MAADPQYVPDWMNGGDWGTYIWTHVTTWWNGLHFFDDWDYSGYDFSASPYSEKTAADVERYGAYGATLRILRGDPAAVKTIEDLASDASTGVKYNRMAVAFTMRIIVAHTMSTGYNFAEYLYELGERDLAPQVLEWCARYPSMPRKVRYFSLNTDAAIVNGAKTYEEIVGADGTVEPELEVAIVGNALRVTASMQSDELARATTAWELYRDGELAGFSRDGVFELTGDVGDGDPASFSVVAYDVRLNPSTEFAGDSGDTGGDQPGGGSEDGDGSGGSDEKPGGGDDGSGDGDAGGGDSGTGGDADGGDAGGGDASDGDTDGGDTGDGDTDGGDADGGDDGGTGPGDDGTGEDTGDGDQPGGEGGAEGPEDGSDGDTDQGPDSGTGGDPGEQPGGDDGEPGDDDTGEQPGNGTEEEQPGGDDGDGSEESKPEGDGSGDSNAPDDGGSDGDDGNDSGDGEDAGGSNEGQGGEENDPAAGNPSQGDEGSTGGAASGGIGQQPGAPQGGSTASAGDSNKTLAKTGDASLLAPLVAAVGGVLSLAGAAIASRFGKRQ